MRFLAQQKDNPCSKQEGFSLAERSKMPISQMPPAICPLRNYGGFRIMASGFPMRVNGQPGESFGKEKVCTEERGL